MVDLQHPWMPMYLDDTPPVPVKSAASRPKDQRRKGLARMRDREARGGLYPTEEEIYSNSLCRQVWMKLVALSTKGRFSRHGKVEIFENEGRKCG